MKRYHYAVLSFKTASVEPTTCSIVMSISMLVKHIFFF